VTYFISYFYCTSKIK